jgi:hypothetical protein
MVPAPRTLTSNKFRGRVLTQQLLTKRPFGAQDRSVKRKREC